MTHPYTVTLPKKKEGETILKHYKSSDLSDIDHRHQIIHEGWVRMLRLIRTRKQQEDAENKK